MDSFKTIKSKITPLDRINVDTDQIIPKQFLKLVQKTGYGNYLFYDWRFDQKNELRNDFILNDPKYAGRLILLTRENFGCGSSREHAVWALLDYGFQVIIAPSFADIFYNNCFKNGMLPITLSESQVEQLFQRAGAEEGYELNADLERQWISDESGLRMSFEIDPFRRECLLKGLDDIGMTLQH